MPLNHNHVTYPNAVLENEIEDQYATKLDMLPFCTIDNSLVGVPGDTVKVNVYSATNGTEILEMGEGNSKNIEVSYAQTPYTILLAQNRFPYYDEQAMNDPKVIETGINHAAVDMLNTVNNHIYAEFAKATQVVRAATPDFAAFVDATSALNLENVENVEIFAFCNPKMKGALRKALKDDLKYIEAFVRTGYIGSVCGVNIFSSKLVPDGVIVGGTKEAVTVFNKLGVEVEQERDADKRLNKLYSRKYFLVALTNQLKAFKILIGPDETSAKLTSMQVGSVRLVPDFDPDTTSYTAKTRNATAKLYASAEASAAEIAIANGATAVTNGAQTQLAIGDNTITFTVTNDQATKTYTATVTREGTGPA